ncbi:two pore domain potassium channel family protein [Nakamurella silvestris]|nr:two pore domain potassium channel family protein [Nakamurella silvestris]
MNSAKWEKFSDGPLTIAALIFLVAYAWQVLGDLSGSAYTVTQVVMWITWGVFGIDYVIGLCLARQRGRWFLRHLLDLAIVLLPILRPLRLLRLVALLTVFQRVAGTNLRGRVAVYIVGSTFALILLSGLAMLDAERHAIDTHITSYGDALWWASATVTTVGYGDVYPVTVTGRFIAVGLMLSGIALLGMVTATLASWLVQRVAEQDEAAQVATRREVSELAGQVEELTRLLKDRKAL